MNVDEPKWDFSPPPPSELKPEDLDPRLAAKKAWTFSEVLNEVGCWVLIVCFFAIVIAGTVGFVRWAL